MTLATAETNSSNLSKLEDMLATTAVTYDTMVAHAAPPAMLQLIRHNLMQLHLQMGEHYLAAGEPRAAAESGRQADLFMPDDREATMLTARALLAANDVGQALPHLERASLIHRGDAAIQALLAQVYMNTGQPRQSLGPFRRAVVLHPGDRRLTAAFANALAMAGETGEAIETYRTLLATGATDVELLTRYALLCNEAGAFDEARVAFGKLIELQPARGLNHRLFGKLRTYEPGDAHILQMEALLAKDGVDPDDARELHFALFHAYETCREFDRAFAHLKTANAIRHKQLNYQPAVFATLFQNIERAFSPARLGPLALSPRPERPIFIVGMPRSGSTLVEQILDSHPDASAAGETTAFAALVEKYLLQRDLSYDLRALGDPVALQTLGKMYIDAIGKAADSGRRTVDKYLTNFMSIGIIKAVFPQARVVHCHRNPLANCFSAYASHFDGNGLAFKADMVEAAEYYVRYHRLMQFWKHRFGDDILDLSYEQLTINQEAETRRLLDYCGLAWTPACLDFHRNARVVRTASYMQVRQPIYDGVDRRTGRYLKHLGPMIQVLQAAGLHPSGETA